MPPVQVQGLPSPRYLATSHRNDLGATSVMGTDDLLEILCVELGRECRGGHEVAEHDREPTIKITRGVSPIRRPSCNGATSLSDAIWMCSGDQGIGLSRSRNASEQYRAFIGAANERAETGPRPGRAVFLTLGYNRVFADRVFADGAFTNRIFANRRGLGNWLRTWKVRSNRCSHES